MTREIEVVVDETHCLVVGSDEKVALLEAKAAGRAIVAIEKGMEEFSSVAPYVVPSWEDFGPELAELIARRHLGLPWFIGKGNRLTVRELTVRDSQLIPKEEQMGKEEEIFRQKEGMEAYIKHRYPFYEFGVWALVRTEDQKLVGLGGVSIPRLPWELGEDLENYKKAVREKWEDWDVLELGYRIFQPFRRQGLGREACQLILSYCHQILCCKVCALIGEKNQASRRLAKDLGLYPAAIRETGSLSPERLLLYVEKI